MLTDLHSEDSTLFHEYFNGENVKGLGIGYQVDERLSHFAVVNALQSFYERDSSENS